MREDARRQITKAEEEATKKFLSYFMVDRHHKITKHGEIKIASLLHLLQISNVSKSDDLQSIKQQQDEMKQQIGGLEETIRKLTHKFEKYVAPSFPSYETSKRIYVSNTSVTNGDSQLQPLYGMPMNSHLGQIPPPSSLLDRSVNLDMTGPSASNRGSSGSNADNLTLSAGQFVPTAVPPRGPPMVANMTEQSGHIHGLSVSASNRPDTRMQNLLWRKTHQIIIYHNNNMFLTLHIRAMVCHAIIGRASFSVGHGGKAGIAMPDRMSPTSQGPIVGDKYPRVH
jgi:hypothetical protein